MNPVVLIVVFPISAYFKVDFMSMVSQIITAPPAFFNKCACITNQIFMEMKNTRVIQVPLRTLRVIAIPVSVPNCITTMSALC